MHVANFALFLAYILWPSAGFAQDSPELGRIADTMVRLCLGGGHTETMSGGGTGGADLSLRSLAIKGALKAEFKVNKSSAEGLVNGIDNARLRAKPLEDLSESQKDTIALLKEKLDLNQRQVRSALESLGEKNVPPEQLAAKLIEIAEKYKDLQTAAAAQPGDDAKITALKAEAQKAIGRGGQVPNRGVGTQGP